VNLTARVVVCLHVQYKNCDKKVHDSIKEHLNVKKKKKEKKRSKKKEKFFAKAGIETATFWLKSRTL
jgi:hypothetical protein